MSHLRFDVCGDFLIWTQLPEYRSCSCSYNRGGASQADPSTSKPASGVQQLCLDPTWLQLSAHQAGNEHVQQPDVGKCWSWVAPRASLTLHRLSEVVLCCCEVVKVAASFCESTSRCDLKIFGPASSHLATVEECDNTAAEVSVVTVFYLVGSVISQVALKHF